MEEPVDIGAGLGQGIAIEQITDDGFVRVVGHLFAEGQEPRVLSAQDAHLVPGTSEGASEMRTEEASRTSDENPPPHLPLCSK